MRECKSGFTAQLSTMKNTLVNDFVDAKVYIKMETTKL